MGLSEKQSAHKTKHQTTAKDKNLAAGYYFFDHGGSFGQLFASK